MSGNSSNNFDCQYYGYRECPDLQADNDIGGKGVVVAFALTAGLALVISVFGLLIDIIDTSTNTNKVDQKFHQIVTRIAPRQFSSLDKPFWRRVVKRTVLGFSDQQLVTGTAILIVAFIQSGYITVYHFSIVMDLAWFSSNTHLLCLVVLHDHLQEFLIRRSWRAFVMFALFAQLFAASILMSHQYWYDSFKCPAICLFKQLKSTSNIGGVPLQGAVTNVAMLIWSYGSALIRLFTWSRNVWQRIEESFVYLYQLPTVPDRLQSAHQLFGQAILWIYIFLGSTFFDICFQIVWFVFGAVGLAQDRTDGKYYMSLTNPPQTEDVWGFGQLIPLFLIALPLLLALEVFFEEWEEAREKAKHSAGQQVNSNCYEGILPVVSGIHKPTVYHPGNDSSLFRRETC